MKHSFKYFSFIIASAAFMITSGCASRDAITTSPAYCAITPDSAGMARLNVKFNVPAHYFSTRSRLVISPRLIAGDSVVEEYRPLVLDAPIYNKKKHRKQVLEGYVDPYEGHAVLVRRNAGPFDVEYNESVEIPAGIGNARLEAVVSADGCGSCTGIDTIDMAGISVPANLIDVSKQFRHALIEPEFKIHPKVHQGKGEARLQFIVDKWDIVMDLADNRRELAGMLETLRPILQDSLATLTSLNIRGAASAEASYQHNVMLANNRAASAKKWLLSQLNIPASVQKIIRTGAAPEGWEPVVQAMIAANDPDSAKVRELMIKYPGPTDDAAEKYIRRLACWPRIRANYLAKDRKVMYDYAWTVRSFTDDAELLEMYKTRPDAFNEDEMLRVSTLAADDKSKMLVYENILRYFPESETAANNLAVLYLNEGRTDDARRLLESVKNLTPEMINTLAATYVAAGDLESAARLLESTHLPEASYNLGLIKARQGKSGQAYRLLRQSADVNSAIAALSINDIEDARRIMDNLSDNSPIAEYVRAMIAAQSADADALRSHLSKAVQDENLRRRAAEETVFRPYSEDQEFIKILTK